MISAFLPALAGKGLEPRGPTLSTQQKPVLQAAGVKDMSKSAMQCLKWCHYLAPFFSNHLSTEAHITIGQIWSDNKAVFNPSWRDLHRWSTEGIQLFDFENRMGVNLHAWLTLETGEIIEPTLLSSYASVRGQSWMEYAGAVVWGYDPGVLNFHRYFPMAVGRAYTEALATRSIIPLLAQNPAELELSAIMIPAG